MNFSDWQQELLAALQQKGLGREDIFSVMLVLTREEKGRKMLAFLRESGELTPDEICEKAGFIAFETEK